MRDYRQEERRRVAFIRQRLASARADGVVFGNSGGKDCALVGILCRRACENTWAVGMPCVSTRNYGQDAEHARLLCERFDIRSLTVDLTATKQTLAQALTGALSGTAAETVADAPEIALTEPASQNINPRLRMTALYAIAQSINALVAGTGNRCERYMGYYTKWGDGAFDFNPIADLTVSEIYEFLRYLGAPEEIIDKPPSAGLFDGQTDEDDMQVTYREIELMLDGRADELSERARLRIERAHQSTEHKRQLPFVYEEM